MEMEEKKQRSFLSVVIWMIPLLLLSVFVLMILFTPSFQNGAYKVKSWFTGPMVSDEAIPGRVERLTIKSQRNINLIESKLEKLKPVKPYIVVNTTANRFSLRSIDGDTIRTGACSTGKNEILIAGNKRIVFKTPTGLFAVQNKQEDRPWIKPDWAFIEDGLPIPSARSASRVEMGSLGDYAMGIGNGYMIHGTLYQRFLGLPVTHGCVRLGDKDLDVVYHTLSKGSKVFIY